MSDSHNIDENDIEKTDQSDNENNKIPESKELVSAENEVLDESEEETFHYEPKLTPKQQKVLQIILGLFCGFLVWFTLGLGSIDQDNSLFRWLFLIVFVVIMIAKNQIEKRTGIMMQTFMKFFLIGLIVFLGVYLIYGATQGMFDKPFISQ